MSKNKLDHIILLRSFAVILVVAGHATRDIHSQNAHMYGPLLTPFWEVLLKAYIYSFHMPLFFWISGYIFFYSTIEYKKEIIILDQIVNKIKRLLVPMYSTSFLVLLLLLLPTIYLFGIMDGDITSQIKSFLLGVNIDHLWFLKTLFLIFMVTIPLSWLIIKHRKIEYTTVMIFCIGMLFSKLSFFSWLDSALYYFPFFIVGCLSRKYESKIDRLNSWLLFIIFFVMHAAVFTVIKYDPEFLPNDSVRNTCSFLGIYFMYFFVKATAVSLRKCRCWAYIDTIDRLSYSIYLFHVTFLYAVLYLDYCFNVNIPVLRVIFSSFGGLYFSIILHEQMRKSKYLSFLFSISAIPSNKISVRK